MNSINKLRLALVIVSIILVGVVGSIGFMYARGYRYDAETFSFLPNGLLVLKSSPDSAQIFIDGKLSTATNATLRLPPDTYDVEIRKDGFLAWKKRFVVVEEVVTEGDATLFRSAPSLEATTFVPTDNPVPSDDFTKLAYAVPVDTIDNLDKAGLWVIETVNLPIGFSLDPRQITDGDLSEASWQWSPDGREILLITKTGSFLLDASEFTPQTTRVNVAIKQEEILEEWDKERAKKVGAKMRRIPEEVRPVFEKSAQFLTFSPDNNFILYKASENAKLAENLVPQLPGSSTQPQERDIITGRTYVYDIKEDRNFLIAPEDNLQIGAWKMKDAERRASWFPTSRHIVLAEPDKITIMDYDGTNRQTVYSGSYVSPHAYTFASKSRLLILTNLGANSSPPNLYTLSLK